jgi:hypothetical protein
MSYRKTQSKRKQRNNRKTSKSRTQKNKIIKGGKFNKEETELLMLTLWEIGYKNKNIKQIKKLIKKLHKISQPNSGRHFNSFLTLLKKFTPENYDNIREDFEVEDDEGNITTPTNTEVFEKFIDNFICSYDNHCETDIDYDTERGDDDDEE